MAATLLAVDDSVTMRKVLEITFAGPDFRVVTASSPDEALQKLKSDRPSVVIADVTLEPKNGYELCKAIKQASPGVPVLILSSKQNPYDAAKGTAAQADDHMDKPFDTTQMIDKVKKLLESKAGVAAAAPVAAPAAAAPKPVAPVAQQPVAAAARPAAAQPTTPANAGPPRAKTLIGTYSPAMGVPAAATPAAPAPPVIAPAARADAFQPTPVSGVPKQPAAAPGPLSGERTAVSPVPTGAAGVAAAHVNGGQMAAKLEGLGLTPAQVDAVMALSREVVERVVWEVVPVLAETIIKEEIARLTK